MMRTVGVLNKVTPREYNSETLLLEFLGRTIMHHISRILIY
jgi:hypothetical protein